MQIKKRFNVFYVLLVTFKIMKNMKWWQKKVKGWTVAFWFTDTPLVSKRAVKYGLSNLAKLVRKERCK